jgi:hypothetical protein
MYTKDKTHRITLRLTDEQFDFVKLNSDTLGVSPSDFLRMVINTARVTTTKAIQDLKKEGGLGRENDKANIDDIV